MMTRSVFSCWEVVYVYLVFAVVFIKGADTDQDLNTFNAAINDSNQCPLRPLEGARASDKRITQLSIWPCFEHNLEDCGKSLVKEHQLVGERVMEWGDGPKPWVIQRQEDEVCFSYEVVQRFGSGRVTSECQKTCGRDGETLWLVYKYIFAGAGGILSTFSNLALIEFMGVQQDQDTGAAVVDAETPPAGDDSSSQTFAPKILSTMLFSVVVFITSSLVFS